ncbi:MAG: Fe3+-citrate ABC transporter substrate-binding protein [Ruminococcus sp.]|nr:Fe3+-citrate ABC transporter substrate-binding protein [Ruminococcus sp.]
MNFKKIIAGVMSAAMLLTGVTGCGSKTESKDTASSLSAVEESAKDNAASEGTRTIVDHTGVEVTIPTELDRIVISSILPLPSVYCLFRGSAEDIIGIHPSSMAAAENSYLINVFPELANADTSFVENGEVNIEQLLSLEPDVVFYSAANTDEREKYDNAGIPAIGFSTTIADFDCVETYAAWISLFGEIYGESEQANKIIEDGRQTAEQIKSVTDGIAEADKPKVLTLFNYGDGVIKTSGSDFFGEYWIETAGGINVASELSGTPEINMEQIYEWDPDIILITNFSAYLPEDLYNNSIEGHDWSNVSAVKNGQVYKFPLGMYRWFPPASDTPLVLTWLAKTIQPELFADVDMDAEIKDFYKEHYGAELTDEDVQQIYNPAREAAGQ